MKKVIMGIGLSGSGKTTVLRSFAEKYGYRYISTDNVRAEFNIQRGETSTVAVWDEIRSRVKEAVTAGETIVMDSTFVTGPDRRTFIEFMRECGVEKVQGVFLDTSAELAWERNSKREHKAPRDVFESRRKDLEAEPPHPGDGFDALFTLNALHEMTRAETKEQSKEFKSFS